MKLFHAPRSPFALKVRILVHELGLAGRVEFVATDPWTDETLRASNPLCKVPTLALPDGGALYDSRVICEYLNDQGGGDLVPAAGGPRWRALRHQALADGLAEAVIRRHVEGLGPPSDRSRAVVARQEAALAAALDALDAEAAAAPERVTIGEIGTAAALTYLSFRSPDIAWREGRPGLASWYEAFATRPSMVATRIVVPAQP